MVEVTDETRKIVEEYIDALWEAEEDMDERDRTPCQWRRIVSGEIRGFAAAAIPLIEAAVVERCAQIVDARKPLYDLRGQLACVEIASSIRASGG